MAGRNPEIFVCYGVRRKSDSGAWIRCWASLNSWCVEIVSTFEPFDMPFVHYRDEDCYHCNLRLPLEWVESGGGFSGLDLDCLPKLNSTFYLVKDVSNWRGKLDLEKR